MHPHKLNLPFNVWRSVDNSRTQFDVAVDIASSPMRTTILSGPTGCGKSAMYYAIAQILCGVGGGRALFTSIQKALQKQLVGDHDDIVSISGAGNYECLESAYQSPLKRSSSNCDTGKCLTGERCHLRESGCLYYDARTLASNWPRVTTNIDYHWKF